MSGIAVPIAIILIGALIIFGVTKMLSTGKNYRDLVEELHSKTFGNRWVAAFELSKFIASEKIINIFQGVRNGNCHCVCLIN